MEHDLCIIKNGKTNVVDSVLLHKKLENSSHHIDWIRRRIDNYGFIEGVDYFRVNTSTLPIEVRGKRRGAYSYLLTIGMAKELSMLENNEIGMNIRKYFIRRDLELRKIEVQRDALIRVRRSLTDALQESEEQDRMHGYAYSTYTRLVYFLTGLSEKKKEYGKKDGFRNTLTVNELKRVESAESMVKALLEMDMEYSEIKESLKPLFKKELQD
jgi:phage anti-repressor protein